MLHLLLDIVPHADGNYYFSGGFWSSLGEALIYALIGFMAVFLGIVLIISIIWFIGFVLRKTNNLAFLKKLNFIVFLKELSSKRRKSVDEPVKATEEINDEVPDEVKAAIVAAIMSYYSTEKPKCEFRVKRIKKL